MQESIRKILIKLKDHNPLQYRSNKENRYLNRISTKDSTFTLDDIDKLNKRVQRLQVTIDSLITDANTVVRYYQELLRDSVQKNQQLNEEFKVFKAASNVEKTQTEHQMLDLTKKIQQLNEELNQKTIVYHDLLQKYQEYQEDNSEVRLQTEDTIQKIKESITKQTLQYEQKIELQRIRIEVLEQEIKNMNKKYQELLEENAEIQKINKDLQIDVNILQEQLQFQQNNQQLWSPKDEDHSSCKDFIPVKGEEDKESYTFEQIKMNFSHEESHAHFPKEVLDISEHYSKFNRTQELLSKEKICSLLQMNSNESKPKRSDRHIDITLSKRLKNKESSKSVYMKIGSIQSKEDLPNSQTNDSNNNQKIQQFKMTEANYEEDHPLNPYRAFFCLMVQCEKMNSSQFNIICDINFDYLYDQFVEQGIPYNFWQQQINKVLKQHSIKTY